MLKRLKNEKAALTVHPAAFGRLCVETNRLKQNLGSAFTAQPPSGGCVLKLAVVLTDSGLRTASRLRAAVC